MQKIMEYTLNTSGATALDVPTGSTVLKADTIVEHLEVLKIWFLVPNDAASTEIRTFKVISTNQEITDNLGDITFISTCVDFGGITQWHIFEIN